MNNFDTVKIYLHMVALYDRVAQSPGAQALDALCSAFGQDFSQLASCWGRFYKTICAEDMHASWPDYLFGRILGDDNPFSAACARGDFLATETHMRLTAKNDLSFLCAAGSITAKELKVLLLSAYPDKEKVIDLLPEWCSEHRRYKADPDWGNELIRLSEHYKSPEQQ